MKTQHVDIVILGGGIAGLWALNRLLKLGFNAILLETNAIGGGQTIQSQGIIHGGIKYALQGLLTRSANEISDMPKIWAQCLGGTGEIDLRQVNILSDYHYLWSTGTLTSKIGGFLANKVLHSHSEMLPVEQYPVIFQNPKFHGSVYQVEETVLDVVSLVHALAKPHLNRLFRVESSILEWSSHHHLNAVVIPSSTVRLHAQAFIFTAGEGNATLTEKITPAIRMQRRPLHMVMVKLPWQGNLYAHCMGATSQPRITITTHYTQAGDTVWYLGGQLAEEGVARSSQEQIAQAQAELVKLFPWADFSQAEWATKHIDRAEAQQTNNQRPDSSSVHIHGNVAVAWPTKLAFAPRLSAQLIAEIKKMGVVPNQNPLFDGSVLEPAPLAKTWWDEVWG